MHVCTYVHTYECMYACMYIRTYIFNKCVCTCKNQAPAPTKAAGHHYPPMQHTKEVLISTDYNLEEALISTNQCLARLIVTFLVKFSLKLTGRQIPSSICLHILQLNLEKIGACIL